MAPIRLPFPHLLALAALSGAPFLACGDLPEGWGALAPGDLDQPLGCFTGTCVFTPSTGLMALVFPGVGDTALLARRVADGAITVNDCICESSDAVPVLATMARVKNIRITGGPADDTVVLDFTNGVFALGKAAGPGILVDLQAGANQFKLRGQRASEVVTVGATGISLGTSYKDIQVAVTSTTEPSFEFALGEGNDVFKTGGSTATGGPCNHALTVFGGAGDDYFDEGLTANCSAEFHGGPGKDTVSYASRTAALTVSMDGLANDGDPSGAGENDNIGSDVEVVVTGSGADTLRSGSTPVTLNGGAGDDTFDEGPVVTPRTVMMGGAGTDTVTYAGRLTTQSIHVTVGRGVGTTADDGDFVAGEKDEIQNDIERIVGGPGNDVLTGGAGNDTLVGGPGNDTLSGGPGNDVFDATNDPGADTYIGGPGVDTVDYSGRTNALRVDMVGNAAAPDPDDGEAGEGDDVWDDVEVLWGGSGNDLLVGNALNNELVGGAGNDTLRGGTGDDVLEGGTATGAQVLDCGDGADIALSSDAVNDTVLSNCEL